MGPTASILRRTRLCPQRLSLLKHDAVTWCLDFRRSQVRITLGYISHVSGSISIAMATTVGAVSDATCVRAANCIRHLKQYLRGRKDEET